MTSLLGESETTNARNRLNSTPPLDPPLIDSIEIRDIQSLEASPSIDSLYADTLAGSISILGLQQPIIVGKAPGRFLLIDGAHRLAAVTQLGWTDIPAIVLTAETNRLEEEFATRARLTRLLHRPPSLLQRARDILMLQSSSGEYGSARVQPEWYDGPLLGEWCLQSLNVPGPAAEKYRISDRWIRRLTLIAGNISTSVQDRLTNTWIAEHLPSLEQLAELTEECQHAVCDHMLSQPPVSVSVDDALDKIGSEPWPS